MKKLFYIVPLISLTVACAGFKPDYIVRDASEKSQPNWLVDKKAYKSDKDADEKKFRYYLNDAENPDQNLCKNLAETRATQRVASEISQVVIQKFKEQSASDDESSTRKIKNTLEKNIQVNLHGVAVTGQYWERRQYLQDLGAEKDRTAYHCHVAVRISVAALTEALEAYKARTLRQLKEEDQKAMATAVDSTIKAIKTGETIASQTTDDASGVE